MPDYLASRLPKGRLNIVGEGILGKINTGGRGQPRRFSNRPGGRQVRLPSPGMTTTGPEVGTRSRTRTGYSIPSMPIFRAADGARVSDVSSEKARKILEDGEVNGKKLTARQRRFFGARASGHGPRRAADGGMVIPAGYPTMLLDMVHDTPYVT